MSHASFSSEWLALREPVDHRSRAPELLEPLRAWCRAAGVERIVDLGSGTGSNVRYLAPRLFPEHFPQGGAGVEWLLVDHDAALLERALAGGIGTARGGASAGDDALAGLSAPTGDAAPDGGRHTLRAVVGDLGTDGLREVAGADLVTAAALLDLVSEGWIDEMVEACRASGAAALFALSYDGRVRWDPVRPMDALVLGAVNAHQRLDKGLGPALGPDAALRAEQRFRAAGWRTRRAASPWQLGPDDHPLVRLLLRGWAEAAIELRPSIAASVREWETDRTALLDGGGAFSVTVGHHDLLALPPAEGAL
ncbi:MAG: class I SAM-dependent methyltransferase [Gemmatimonadales bacterium]|nr:MAG: class I SAM-dependent methyltransferase [Gemmatimonadales bacterium]